MGAIEGGAAELTTVVLQELNERWRSLQQLAEERSQLLGSAHEVQRFHRCGAAQGWGGLPLAALKRADSDLVDTWAPASGTVCVMG